MTVKRVFRRFAWLERMTVDSELKRLAVRFKGAWLRRLQKAYGDRLWSHGLNVPRATLELARGGGFWGRWVESGRLIQISEELILNHPWAAVLGILGHEVAHQLATDLGGGAPGETAHGRVFQSMAARLGLDAFYRRAAVEIMGDCPRPWPEPEAGGPVDEGARALEKVRKLLALSASPVAAEAQAAMNAAARLMARHNLDVLGRDLSEAGEVYERRIIELKVGRIQARLAAITVILNRHFFVETIFVPGYNALADVEEKNLELLGRPENTRLAEHVFHFLLERTESLWQEHRRNSRVGGGLVARNSFISGLLHGFDQKLTEAAAESAATLGLKEAGGFSALVLSRDQGLKDFVRRRHPRLKFVRAGGRYYCPDSEKAGRQAGRALNFTRPLEASAGAKASADDEPRLLR
ncbi:MAG: DUF2786 domain-containing protein [Candidatus Adiutrix sp.]|jgi:hypothetical protein|nr:DUF2786 domain-containing protein [Candidatus Adiutrix sp.]